MPDLSITPNLAGRRHTEPPVFPSLTWGSSTRHVVTPSGEEGRAAAAAACAASHMPPQFALAHWAPDISAAAARSLLSLIALSAMSCSVRAPRIGSTLLNVNHCCHSRCRSFSLRCVSSTGNRWCAQSCVHPIKKPSTQMVKSRRTAEYLLLPKNSPQVEAFPVDLLRTRKRAIAQPRRVGEV